MPLLLLRAELLVNYLHLSLQLPLNLKAVVDGVLVCLQAACKSCAQQLHGSGRAINTMP